MLAFVLVNQARVTLIDTQKVTWSDAELLAYLNEGRRHAVMLKNDALPVRADVALVAGSAQSIPAGAVALLDIVANTASGAPCTVVDLEMLQQSNRLFFAATQETDAQHWATDTRDPRRFYVSPPNNGSGSVLMLYGSVPADVALNEDIVFTDAYQYTLECFVLARAYAKDTRRQDLAKAASYMQRFEQSLGLRSQTQIATAPNVIEKTGT